MTKKENCEAQREKHQTEETQIERKRGIQEKEKSRETKKKEKYWHGRKAK